MRENYYRNYAQVGGVCESIPYFLNASVYFTRGNLHVLTRGSYNWYMTLERRFMDVEATSKR